MRRRDPVTPTKADIAAWRAQAEAVVKFGGVRLGEFDWPWVVLSLIGEWENRHEPACNDK